jgi:hypothetical protein
MVHSVDLSGIALLKNSRQVMASVLQLPLLCDLNLSNTKLGDAGLQLLLDLLLSLDKQQPIRSPPLCTSTSSSPHNVTLHAAPSSPLTCRRTASLRWPLPASGTR